MSKKHKWSQFAKIVGAPYNKRFSTDGWGEFRIDSKGIYSYEHKEYDEYLNCDNYSGFLRLFLTGEIVVLNDYN